MPFTYADLGSAGLTPQALRAHLASGDVLRMLRGVYGAATLPDTIETRIAAASKVLGEHHTLIDRSAAWIHGVDCFGAAELEAGPSVESCVRPRGSTTRRPSVSDHQRDLREEDVMRLGGIHVTTPLRTALDLGCHLRRREAYAAMCELARLHDLSAGALTRQVSRFAGRRGVVQLRELAPLVDPRFESQREAWTFLAIHDAGLPRPEPQLWIVVDGEPTFRLDLAYRLARVCIEYQGKETHESTPEQIAHDAWRLEWLRDHGWTVIEVREGDFTGEALDRWLRELREALAMPYSSRRW
jgi:hypothetical protein